MKRLVINQLILSFFIGIVNVAFGQPERILVRDSLAANLMEVCYVLKDKPEIKHGKYSYLFYGGLLVQGNYHVNKMHGKWTRYYSKGQPHIVATFNMNRPHGKWTFYYPNGQIMSKIQFNKGQKVGVWQGFSPSGFTSSMALYKNGILQEFRQYYDILDADGKPILAQKAKINFNGKDTVKYEHKYYDNGQLFQASKYINDALDSTQVTYYKPGLLWQSFVYEKGRLIEIPLYKTRVGSDLDKGSFREGNGELKTYDFDGELKGTIQYKDGLKNGRAVYVNKGMNWAEGYFNNGKRAGKWLFFDPKMNSKDPDVEYNFISDTEIHMTYYGGINSGKWEGPFKNGRKQGVWRLYNAYNEVIAEHKYHLGFRHGISETRRSGGALESRGGYFYGIKTGTWNYYNNNNRVVYSIDYSQNVSANEEYLASVIEIGDNYEQLYYNDKSQIGTAGWSNQSNVYTRQILGGNFSGWTINQIDRRNIKPVPAIRTEFDLNPIIYPADIGYLDLDMNFEKRLAAVMTSEKKREKGDPEYLLPGVYMIRYNLGYFGEVKETELIRRLGLENEKALVDLIEKYRFFNPRTVELFPTNGDEIFRIATRVNYQR